MILPFDLHHHGEQILPWQQIVELGQKAYEDLVTPKEPRVFNESEMIDIKNHLTDLKNSVE